MNKIAVRNIFAGLGLFVLALGLTGCDDWSRLKNVGSASIVSIQYADDLVAFDKYGNKVNSSTDIGLSEVSNVLGGLLSGKGVESTQEVFKKRTDSEKQTFANVAVFQKSFKSTFTSALRKNKIKVKKFDTMSDPVDFNNVNLVKGLVGESGADAIAAVSNQIGYVKTDKNFGMTKAYRLVLKSKLLIADIQGKIGEKVFFVMATRERSTDGPIPVFTKADFDSLARKYSSKIRVLITEKRYN